MSERIGFYICHCGINIAFRVRVEEVAEYVATLPNVAVSRHYLFMCSDPGQELIERDIAEHRLTRVVVASCSPRMHERTFRGACQRAGLNPFRAFHMVSVREHVSWVIIDGDEATEKAILQPVPHNVPQMFLVDMNACNECGECVAQCPPGAIDLTATEEELTVARTPSSSPPAPPSTIPSDMTTPSPTPPPRTEMLVPRVVAKVYHALCARCRVCIDVCPFEARAFSEEEQQRARLTIAGKLEHVLEIGENFKTAAQRDDLDQIPVRLEKYEGYREIGK